MATNKEPTKIFYVHDDRDLKIAVEAISTNKPTSDTPWVITLGQDDESRSLKQNRLSFLWYGIRGGATNEGRAKDRAFCKLTYGVPILREGKDFNAFYCSALAPLEYEQRLDAMEFVPVTSLMTTRQFAEYLDEIDKQSLTQGVVLPQPEDLYWAALMKESERG
jgi:hypothetical protein